MNTIVQKVQFLSIKVFAEAGFSIILSPIKEVEDLKMRKDLSCVMCREGSRFFLHFVKFTLFF